MGGPKSWWTEKVSSLDSQGTKVPKGPNKVGDKIIQQVVRAGLGIAKKFEK